MEKKNKYAAALGRKGGKSRSPAKVAAARENVKKALAARLKRAQDADFEEIVNLLNYFRSGY